MEQFTAFEDVQLEALVQRSKRAEQDLEGRVSKRILQVQLEDRWLRSDPIYQRLSGVLSNVRRKLTSAEQELKRRAGGSVRGRASSGGTHPTNPV